MYFFNISALLNTNNFYDFNSNNIYYCTLNLIIGENMYFSITTPTQRAIKK